MLFERCIACNLLKTDSCTSCVCGHVFENSKQIGGKRFSEYRAELYHRLENRRMKRLTRENRKAQSDKQSKPLKERMVLRIGKCLINSVTNTTDETGVIRSSFKPKAYTSAGSKTFNRRRIKSKTLSRPIIDSVPNQSQAQSPPAAPRSATTSKTTVPPELVSRLPSALQEINRRLTGQNLMWWTMHWLQ
ncbi:uncharacterized protein LOC144644329 isoform X1 [Oculina patagonica]